MVRREAGRVLGYAFARPPPPNLLLGAVLARARFAARELAPLRVFRSGSRGRLRGQVGVVVTLRRRSVVATLSVAHH
jgi:hypothetical protein